MMSTSVTSTPPDDLYPQDGWNQVLAGLAVVFFVKLLAVTIISRPWRGA